MSGRPAGPGSQAERVVRLYRALTGATPVWFKQLALDLGRSERTIRRDLEVVSRAVAPGHVVEHAADGQVRLVALDRRGQLAPSHTQTMPCPGCAAPVTPAPVVSMRPTKGGAR